MDKLNSKTNLIMIGAIILAAGLAFLIGYNKGNRSSQNSRNVNPAPDYSQSHTISDYSKTGFAKPGKTKSSHSAEGYRDHGFDDFPMPVYLELCEEKVPLKRRHVTEMLDREFNISVWDRAQVFMWLKRAARYFPYIEKSLKDAGIPSDIKYLAVAESALLTQIASNKQAIGPWQFLKGTGREQGLRIDSYVDERMSIEKSTLAAIKYLKYLKNRFGTWALAMAAYNCGAARLDNYISEQKTRDYYQLNLPLETERYIFRILAIKIIMSNTARYGYTIPEKRLYMPIEHDKVQVNMPRMYHITEVAKRIGSDLKTIREMNPWLRRNYLPKGRYSLKLPVGTGNKFSRAVRDSKAASSKSYGAKYHVVKRGENLTIISRKTSVSISKLRRLNNIKGSKIHVGQKLKLR